MSVSRIVGEIFPYLVTWTWAVGMLTWLAIAWSVVRWWQTRGASDPRVGQIALGVVAFGLVVVSVVNTVDAATAGNPDPIGSRQVEELVAKVRDALPSGDGVVEIRGGTTAGSAWIGAGIAAQLERDGIDTRVAPNLGFAYGPDRVLGDEPVRLVVLPVEQPDVAATKQLPCFENAGRVGEVHPVRRVTRVSRAQSRMKSTLQSPVSANSGCSRLRRMQSSSTSVSISVRMKHR